MAYNYPYGAVPQQGYRAQVNPVGYASPVAQANPFSALVLAHGMRSAFSGSSSSGDPDVAIVTYDSYMEDKDFTLNRLGLNSSDVKKHGKPLGLKFKDCGVVIPLPSKVSVCDAIDRQINFLTNNRTLSDKEKKSLLKDISEELAIEFFTNQCNPKKPFDAEGCGFPAVPGGNPSEIAAVDKVVRTRYPNP